MSGEDIIYRRKFWISGDMTVSALLDFGAFQKVYGRTNRKTSFGGVSPFGRANDEKWDRSLCFLCGIR